MRRSNIVAVVALALFVLTITVAGQSETWVGTWKRNIAKSTYSPGPVPTAPLVAKWESLGGGRFKNTQDSVDAKGQPTRIEIVFAFDGKDYPIKGNATPSSRAYRRIDDHTLEMVTKVNGKAVGTSRSVMAADGKTRTFTTTGTNAQGEPTKSVLIWEKQ